MSAYAGSRTLILGFAAVLAISALGAASRKSGALDASFAGDGSLFTFIPPILDPRGYNHDQATAVAIDASGRIVVAGYTSRGRQL